MSGAPSWRNVIRRLVTDDYERTAVVLVVFGTVLTIGIVLFGSYVPSIGRRFVTTLYPLALLFPAFGLGILVTALWWVWTARRTTAPPLQQGSPPETGETYAIAAVNRDTERTLEIAANAQYSCRTTDSSRALRTRLVDSAVRVVTTRRGLTDETARDRVRSGEWTDDAVAAAFLASDRPQPIGERLRGAVDPGAAYRRRVRRTVTAIEALERGGFTADAANAANISDTSDPETASSPSSITAAPATTATATALERREEDR